MEIASSSSRAKDFKSAAAAVPSRRRRNICIGISIAAVVFLVLLIVILALTVFKPKHPITTVNSVALADLDVSLDIARFAVHINLTLTVDMSILNPNKVGFSYSNSTANLGYRGRLIGEAPVRADRIGADQNKRMNLTLTVMADRLLTSATVFSDAVAGALPLNVYARISGTVRILGVFNIHVVSTTSCDLIIDIKEGKIGDQHCNYRTKI